MVKTEALAEVIREYIDDGGSSEIHKEAIEELRLLKEAAQPSLNGDLATARFAEKKKRSSSKFAQSVFS